MSIPGGSRPAERPRDRLSLLRNHSLFRDLPPAVIERLGSYMKTRRAARGSTIFRAPPTPPPCPTASSSSSSGATSSRFSAVNPT
jgi:hypothetical protein